MTSRNDVVNAIHNEILRALDPDRQSFIPSARDVRELAERYAWTISQTQPHGGSVTVKAS